MVIVVEGNKIETSIDDKEVIRLVNSLVEKGLSKKDAIDFVSEVTTVRKNHIKDII